MRYKKVGYKKDSEALGIEQKRRGVPKAIENSRGWMFGHLIRHDSALRILIDAKIEGKGSRGRLRLRYLDQVSES